MLSKLGVWLTVTPSPRCGEGAGVRGGSGRASRRVLRQSLSLFLLCFFGALPSLASTNSLPPSTIGGVLKAVSQDGKELTVSVGSGKNAKNQVFRVTPQTRITLDGKESKPADLPAGAKVTATYDKLTSELLAVTATTAKAA